MAARPEQIVLVGLPGSGKSTVGPILAGRLGWAFTDFDTRIEADSGMSVREIFQHSGEAEFRRLESDLTGRLASVPRTVLSPGGGWILRNTLPHALLVWLKVDPKEAIERMGGEAGDRPLLRAAPLEGLSQLLAEREHHYMRADITIDTNGKSPDAVAAEIVAAIETYGNQKEE